MRARKRRSAISLPPGALQRYSPRSEEAIWSVSTASNGCPSALLIPAANRPHRPTDGAVAEKRLLPGEIEQADLTSRYLPLCQSVPAENAGTDWGERL